MNRLLMHVRLLKAPETNTNQSRANKTCLTKQYLYCVPPYNVSPRKTTSPAVRKCCYITNTRRSILMMHRSDVIALTSKSHFRRPSRLVSGLTVQTDCTLNHLNIAVNLIWYVIHLTQRANKTCNSQNICNWRAVTTSVIRGAVKRVAIGSCMDLGLRLISIGLF